MLEHHRDTKVGEFGREQTGQSERNAQLILHQIGEQVANNAPVASLSRVLRVMRVVYKLGGAAASVSHAEILSPEQLDRPNQPSCINSIQHALENLPTPLNHRIPSYDYPE